MSEVPEVGFALVFNSYSVCDVLSLSLAIITHDNTTVMTVTMTMAATMPND